MRDRMRLDGAGPAAGRGGMVGMLVAAGLVGALGAAAPAVRAADSVYLTNGVDEPCGFRMNRISGWTQVGFRASREEADAFDIDETLISPRLFLRTDGCVYHEKLLTYRLDTSLSLEKQTVSGGPSRDGVLAFTDYNASLLFLPEKAVNLDLFAHRDNAWIDAPFRSSYRVRSTNWGAELRTSGRRLPVSLAFGSLDRTEELPSRERREERENVRLGMKLRTRLTESDLSFRFADHVQSVQPQDYETIDIGWNNTLRFGSSSPSRLRGSLRHFHQYGSIERRSLGITGDVLLDLPHDLRHTVRYNFHNQALPAAVPEGGGLQTTRSHAGDVGVQHVLYGSLTTSLNVLGSRETVRGDVSGSDREIASNDRWQVRSGLSYRRRTPVGRLSLGFGYDRGREDQSAVERVRFVSDERHVLRDGEEPQLERIHVDPATVVVTDETGFLVYEEGADYRLVTFGPFVKIFRIPGGRIADEQVILVDYGVRVSPDLSFDTFGRSFRVRFDAPRSVTLHYRYDRRDEEFLSGTRNGFLENQRNHVMGIRWGNGVLTIGDEYEIYRLEESGSEFRTNRIHFDAHRKLGVTRVQLGGHYSRSTFPEAGRTLDAWLASARLVSTPGRGLLLEGDIWVRVERGDPGDAGLDSDVHGVSAKATRQLRALTVSAGISYRRADDAGVDDDRRIHGFTTIRRAF